MLKSVKTILLGNGSPTFALLIILELVYFTLSMANMTPLIIAIISFPSLFIVPGFILLVALGHHECSILKLIVEGFFISTLMSIALTSLMLEIGCPLTPFAYSLVTLVLVTFLVVIASTRESAPKPSRHELLILALAFSLYVLLMVSFAQLQRVFTPDETSYIFSARMGLLNGLVPPTGFQPGTSGIVLLLQGRFFWTYLLTSFLGATGLPADQAGLLGASFLITIALTSSLFVNNERLRVAVFLIVAINPLLFLFSALSLNDLAISFYIVFAILFFVKSFSRVNNSLLINFGNLLCALSGFVAASMIKLNLLFFLVMYIILAFFTMRYKLYKVNRKYKIILLTILLSVLLYELCIDIPYVISIWVFRNSVIGSLFKNFLFVSPAETFVGWFVAPWWNPIAPTLLTQPIFIYIDYFYRLLMPESSSLVVAAIILALPILMMSRKMRGDLEKTVLASYTVLSFYIFYFEALCSVSPLDVDRYSLWMIPLWIPLALMVLQDAWNSPSPKKLLPVFAGMFFILLINVSITRLTGGVPVGYPPYDRFLTMDQLALQFVSLTSLLCLLFVRRNSFSVKVSVGRRIRYAKAVRPKTIVSFLVIALILVNGVYFCSQFRGSSVLYEDHGLAAINDSLGRFQSHDSIVFANNYIQMRPYISNGLFSQGLLIPPPDTKEGFLQLLGLAPNNTLLLISDDYYTTYYESANNYIKDYVKFDVITPENLSVSKMPKLNLTEPILTMSFDDANDTTVPDHSGVGNNGINNGATIDDGYYGKALNFSGGAHVSIPNNEILNVQNETTISFFAMIEEAEPSRHYVILSKGYPSQDGSFGIFIYDNKVYFQLDGVGSLHIQVDPYIGVWHHFIFTYDAKEIRIYVDGSPKASIPANGLIANSSYDVEIGRDSEAMGYFFTGLIDELQISVRAVKGTDFVNNYYTTYAIQIQKLHLAQGQAGLFSIVNDIKGGNPSVAVRGSSIGVKENSNITISVQIDSPERENVTILVGTDRFTEVHVISLLSGLNHVEFQYARDDAHWLYLSQVRLIVIENNSIVYSRFMTVWGIELTNILLLPLSLGIIGLCLFPLYKRRQ